MFRNLGVPQCHIVRLVTLVIIILCVLPGPWPVNAEDESPSVVISPDALQRYVGLFNATNEEDVVNHISDADAFRWMRRNIPRFECPDRRIEEVFYFRFWIFRKHIKQTADGFVITEFLTPVRHAGVHNTISCAVGHHLYEGRWLHDQTYLDDYISFWLRGHAGGPQPHLHRYSNWLADAVVARDQVHPRPAQLIDWLPDLIADYRRWEMEKKSEGGLFWQYDVRDGMEESISGSRTAQNRRPTINSYLYAHAKAIARIAEIAGQHATADEFTAKASELRRLVQEQLWDPEAQFFKVQFPDGSLSDAREQIGFVPWYFQLPEPGYEAAWRQLTDPAGFWAPCGITTAERRHAGFRTHGTGTSCEWDGPVWPFATSQTLVAMAQVLRNDPQSYIAREDYFRALQVYAQSHQFGGRTYLGEYLDETTGAWLKGDSERSRHYNHSTFADLIITGLVGLTPRPDDLVEVNPLIPADRWSSFCLDQVLYHGRVLAIIWDETGQKYGHGPGFRLLADGTEIAHTPHLERMTGRLP